MRIVHVANFYGPRSGGIRTAMHATAREYLARGHEPVLVVPGPEPSTTVAEGVRVVTVPAPLVPGIGGYRVVTRPGAVRSVLGELEPDRLEVSDRTTLTGLGDWARAEGVPSLLVLHERVDGVLRAFWPGAGKGARPHGGAGIVGSAIAPVAADRWNAATFRRFDRLVATTGFAAAEAERLAARRPEHVPPLHRVPLGVDLDLFSPDRYDATTRATLARPGEAVVLVVSRLSGEKRVDLALDAVVQVVRDGRPARLVVAGTGPQFRRLRARAHLLGLDNRFLGFVPDRGRLATLLACADVVVAPGPIETFGLAALEALASGTPVVSSATSALPEVVGGAGAVGAPDAQALALAVHEVLERPVARRRAAARARAELFPWSATGEAMLRIHGAAPGPDGCAADARVAVGAGSAR
jgi:alpha-1,6-mannosyltransferase